MDLKLPAEVSPRLARRSIRGFALALCPITKQVSEVTPWPEV